MSKQTPNERAEKLKAEIASHLASHINVTNYAPTHQTGASKWWMSVFGMNAGEFRFFLLKHILFRLRPFALWTLLVHRSGQRFKPPAPSRAEVVSEAFWRRKIKEQAESEGNQQTVTSLWDGLDAASSQGTSDLDQQQRELCFRILIMSMEEVLTGFQECRTDTGSETPSISCSKSQGDEKIQRALHGAYLFLGMIGKMLRDEVHLGNADQEAAVLHSWKDFDITADFTHKVATIYPELRQSSIVHNIDGKYRAMLELKGQPSKQQAVRRPRDIQEDGQERPSKNQDKSNETTAERGGERSNEEQEKPEIPLEQGRPTRSPPPFLRVVGFLKETPDKRFDCPARALDNYSDLLYWIDSTIVEDGYPGVTRLDAELYDVHGEEVVLITPQNWEDIQRRAGSRDAEAPTIEIMVEVRTYENVVGLEPPNPVTGLLFYGGNFYRPVAEDQQDTMRAKVGRDPTLLLRNGVLYKIVSYSE